MSPFAIPVRRPVATSMFFLALLLLGLIAWYRIPVELFPATEGNQLTVRFFRPGSEPEVVEREILLPLEARAAELPDIKETSAEIRGSNFPAMDTSRPRASVITIVSTAVPPVPP